MQNNIRLEKIIEKKCVKIKLLIYNIEDYITDVIFNNNNHFINVQEQIVGVVIQALKLTEKFASEFTNKEVIDYFINQLQYIYKRIKMHDRFSEIIFSLEHSYFLKRLSSLREQLQEQKTIKILQNSFNPEDQQNLFEYIVVDNRFSKMIIFTLDQSCFLKRPSSLREQSQEQKTIKILQNSFNQEDQPNLCEKFKTIFESNSGKVKAIFGSDFEISPVISEQEFKCGSEFSCDIT